MTPWWVLQPVHIAGFLRARHLKAVTDQELADLDNAVRHLVRLAMVEMERRSGEKS